MNFNTEKFKKGLLSFLILTWSGFVLVKFYHSAELAYLPALLSNIFFWPKGYLLAGYLWTVVNLLVFIFQNTVIGALILSRVNSKPGSQLEQYLLSFGLGVISWSYLTFLLGLAGFLDPFFFQVLFWLSAFGCAVIAIRKKELFCFPLIHLPAVKGFFSKVCLGFILLTAVLNLAGALGPEIHYDTLFYHMALPAAYQLRGQITTLPFNSFSFLPQNMEMLYLFSILVNNDLLARLLHWLMGLGSMLLVYLLGRKYFSRPVAFLAAACFYLIPQVSLESWTAMNDLGVVFFVLLSWLCFLAWLNREKPSPVNLYLAAVFAGFALGIKFIAFPLVIITILLYFLQYRRLSGTLWPKIKPIVWYSLIILLLIAPWLVRNAVSSGSIFAPFSLARFKLELYLNDCQQLNSYHWQEILLVPWQKILDERSLDSLIGPLFLVALPLLVVLFDLSRHQPAIKKLSLFLLVYFILWRSQTSTWRYFLPALPVFCLLIGGIAYSIKIDSFNRKILLGVFFLVFYGNLGLIVSALQQKQTTAVISGTESRESYLTKSHMFYPSPSFAAIAFLNRLVPADTAVLFVGETRTYYSRFKAIANSAFDYPTFQEYFKKAQNAAELASDLQQDGISYILFNEYELQRMQQQYKMFDFSRQDLLLLSEFWPNNSRRLYYKDGVGVYQIIEKRIKPIK